MEILIIRISAIGDVIHTLPAIFYIKKMLPRAKISWVVQEKAASLLKNQPFIDNLYILPNKFLKPKNWGQTLSIIKKLKRLNSPTLKWDAIIDFQGLLKTSILIATLRGKKFGFSKNNTREQISRFFTHHHTTPQYKNIIQKNLALASNVIKALSSRTKTSPYIQTLKKDFYIHVPPEKRNLVDAFINDNLESKTFITLAPNTTWPSKHWPKKHWLELIKILSHHFNLPNKSQVKIALLGKDFGEQASQLSIALKKTGIAFVPKWDLLTTAYLIKKTKLLVAPDTGILHLGDFLGTRTIGLFGPTLASKHGPFITKQNIDSAIQIPCTHRYKKSHNGMNCMQNLSPSKLFKTILQRLN